jgi:hypothetical protein
MSNRHNPPNGEGADSRRRPTKTATADDHRDLIAFGPMDEARPRVESSISNLTRTLTGELPMVEATIVQLERVGLLLRMVA